MAETEELPPQPVQELASDANELPRKYIFKEVIENSFPLLDVPEIDIGLLQSSSSAHEEEITKLQPALSSCGCFQAINHGVTDSFLDEVRAVSNRFFALPREEKQRYGRSKGADEMEGYGNDSVLSENQTLDWNDRLFLTVSPDDQKQLHLWPQNPENFREILEEYVKNLKILSEIIVKAMAESLNLDENCFMDKCGKHPNMVARFNFYPPCWRPDLILGIKPHADSTVITFLLQDREVEGLQVLKDDQWYRVPIVPYAILVNVGDIAEIMSNGMVKSPVHRVVTNPWRERNTLAVFVAPEPDKEVGPVEELINEERPRLYKKIKNYPELFFPNYQQGKRPIEVAKI